MSQADLDKLIEQRLAKAKKGWDDEAKTKADRDKMDEAERLKAEKADAEKSAADKVKGANVRLVKAEAKVAALAAGVKPDRIDRFLRNVDLDDIDVDDDGGLDAAAVKKAVGTALEDVPEFKGGSTNGNGNGSGKGQGEFGGDGAKVWTRAEIDKLTLDEYEKHADEILAQVKAGTVK